MKVTVQAVADRARVSLGTVSRVINRDPSVSVDLTERVRRSIEELGYTPLRRRRAEREAGLSGRTIGLLTLGMDRSLSKLPVVTAAIDGIREALGEAGATLQWFDAPDPSADPAWCKRARCAGWLIKGAMQGNAWKSAHPALWERIEGRPCVWFHGRPPGAPGGSAGVDDWEVGAVAAAYLHERGHRTVGFLSPKSNHLLLKRRQQGFVATCEELGLSCRVVARNHQAWSFPLERPKSLAAVDSLLGELLESRRNDFPTAIFVPADSIAVLLYRALAERGLRVPEDIGVISANREEALIAGLFPNLTTIDVHAEQVGREAVAALARLFEDKDDGGQSATREIRLAPTLFPGESVRQLSSS